MGSVMESIMEDLIKTAPMVLFIGILLVCAIEDLRRMIIPNWAVAVGAAAGLLGAAFGWIPGVDIVGALLGALLCGGGLLLLSLIVYRLKGRWALGMGDVKLVGMAGIWLGAPCAFLGIFFAAFLGLIYTVCVFFRVKEWREIPFGAFLAIAFILCVFFGEYVINLYLIHLGLL